MQPPQLGNENREQILPSNPNLFSKLMPPKYDFVDQIPLPGNIGVRRDDTLGSVVDAAKGMMYYTDMIGFGQKSTGFTAGEPRPLGINYFMPSGLKCSNGADMWVYFEGIPKGDALGKRFNDALTSVGYPKMQGLAPGIVEDAKAALNPTPLLQAAFGQVYPVCEKKRMRVGDSLGNTYDPNQKDKDGTPTNIWIKGDIQYVGGVPTQERWIQKLNAKGEPIFISQKEWFDTPKTEGFEDVNGRKESLLIAIILFSLAWGISCGRK
jgi:hypothetical protein